METIAAMRHQETQCYGISDAYDTAARRPLHEQAVTEDTPVDSECRTKMVSWAYQVVDYCQFQREVVQTAFNLLDRFVLTTPLGRHTALTNRKMYQLAAMTCLYTAVKVHETAAMDIHLVATLSRGSYTVAEIETMEAQIVAALHWRLNPPTTLSFCRQFLELIPPSVFLPSNQVYQVVYNLAKYQAELAVGRSDLVSIPASHIAFCALMNAFYSIDDKFSETLLTQISNGLWKALLQNEAKLPPLLPSSIATEVALVQQRLIETVLRQQPPIERKSSSSSNPYADMLLRVLQQQPKQQQHSCSPQQQSSPRSSMAAVSASEHVTYSSDL